MQRGVKVLMWVGQAPGDFVTPRLPGRELDLAELPAEPLRQRGMGFRPIAAAPQPGRGRRLQVECIGLNGFHIGALIDTRTSVGANDRQDRGAVLLPVRVAVAVADILVICATEFT